MKVSDELWSPDRQWGQEQWRELLDSLIGLGLVRWRDVTSLVLGELNPPQVGTSLASNPNIKRQYPPRKAWAAVREWLYAQGGRCEDCGSRFDLQVEHIIPKEEIGGEADELSNLRLTCRRCNVVKRPSHKKGGLTFQTAQAALMWILFVYRPKTYESYKSMCRKYGLTMADIRFQEAWAMAIWLSREGAYTIERNSEEDQIEWLGF